VGSQQNGNPDGTVTVTKLAGMAILGAAEQRSTRYFLVMHGVTLLLEKLKNLKRIFLAVCFLEP
jgi:hypothetical protein